MNPQPKQLATLFVRLALALSFLSAVADRFGIWGEPGDAGVSWGQWSAFVEYTAILNPLAPGAIIPALAWTATLLEVAIAVSLLVGFKLKYTALASGVLLLIFAGSMTFTLGIKSALDYSVFTAAAGSFLLAAIAPNASKS